MVSQPIMNTVQKAASHNMGIGLKGSSLHRTHYSAPSGAGYHQHHHIYHMSDSDGYGSGHSHSDHGGGKKRSIALSALTLLAFLFFLNILQNCLEDQMDDMNPQVIVMSSRLQQFKEAQKRLVDTKTDRDGAEGKMKTAAGNFEKLHRTADKTSSSSNYPNTTLKIITKNNNKRWP